MGVDRATTFGLFVMIALGCGDPEQREYPVGNSWGRSMDSSGGGTPTSSRGQDSDSPDDAEVVDVRFGESGTPVVAVRLRWGTRNLTLVSAPEISPDYVSAILQSDAGLRGCAEMQVHYGTSFANAELASFDRQATRVQYELPLGGVVRAAASAEARVEVCGAELALDGVRMAELRRMVLLALYRRRQEAPALPLPTLETIPADGDASSAPVRGSLRLSPADTLTLVYDAAEPEQVALELRTALRNGFAEDCEVGLEAGPAAIGATQLEVEPDRSRMVWTVDNMDDFFAIGVTDHAQINYCNRRFDFEQAASGVRRFVLVAMLQRAEHLGAAPVLELPPAERRESSGFQLPRRRGEGGGVEVVPPADAPREGAL